MQSILVMLREIYCNHFKCLYLKNQNIFGDILLYFQNVRKILDILEKNFSSLA